MLHLEPQTPILPVIFGKDVRDNSALEEIKRQDPISPGREFYSLEVSLPEGPVPIHIGRNTSGAAMLLYKSTWENPNPDVPVDTIDFISTMSTAAPFLIAITVEP